jgi:hypothetical protein
MSVNDKKTDKHESYAMLSLSRTHNSGGLNLFGSSIKHYDTIRLRISEGEVDRSLSTDWYHTKNIPYIEVEMSYSQFAEAITSLNQGSGVPVTLRQINGKRIEQCPFTNKRQEFEEEFESEMVEMATKLKGLTQKAEEILNSKKVLTKSDKEEILSGIKSLQQEVGSNIPYMQQCFNEQMDKTVLEAKGEVEGFVMNKIITAGLNGLQKDLKLLD